MKLFIKNMVTIRCKMIVKAELEKLDLEYFTVELGEVTMKKELAPEQTVSLKSELAKFGLELMDDKKSILIEKIKQVIIEMIHYSDELPKINFSKFIGNKLGHDYTYLANLFSEVQGITIEHYIIIHKIERVKELIVYDELNLTEIAALMQYSSVAHLSRQFKKVTGLTPTFFKQMKDKRRRGLENV
jgi:AraC-like DNA-binding protein